jgi:microcystin-dependent protein
MPSHTHLISPPVNSGNGGSASPVNAYPATLLTTVKNAPEPTLGYAAAATAQTEAPFQSGIAGGNVPFGIQQPYLAIYFIIAWQGIFPPRP